MNDLKAQEELYNAWISKIDALQTEYAQKKNSLKKENKQLIDKNRELKSSLSDKTLLLAVDYEKLSAAFGVLNSDFRKESINLDKIKIEREKQTKEYEVDRWVYDKKITELIADFEQKKYEIVCMEAEKNHLINNVSDLKSEIHTLHNNKKMIEDDITKLKLIQEDINNVESEIVKFREIKDSIIKDIEKESKRLQELKELLKELEGKISIIESRELSVTEREWFISEKENWVDQKRKKLQKAKLELEAFYERKLNHINLD